ncbi:hypothetical protein O6H91_22G024200 [Diphasiastrum complanatum]|uniref:Uncharacterized protein n=1 Tax=Diphasiastrum complanatum TaxID=34168 RepID=A0ACC2ADR2_DIPCM|nr:hypothetical protein O6H91_22G024200 [Diphasiastrum complanatum]
MASGFGLHGGKGRCFDVWMDFSECISRCTMPAECALLRDDYFECLHHRKEFSRLNAINKERERQTKEKPKGEDTEHH